MKNGGMFLSVVVVALVTMAAIAALYLRDQKKSVDATDDDSLGAIMTPAKRGEGGLPSRAVS